jgi:hypothetical protein
MQVAHRQKGGFPVEEKDPTNPWPAPCHIGSRRPGRSPRPVAALTRQGIPNNKNPSRYGRVWVGTNSTL